ncbi:Helicase IV [Serratia rubidaea]|uniref:Helicase IV n=1 Tax=Serratia rubidaea TaxID=61652 RepID=A0A4U9HCT2_SERRU|nr:Helicase IV [Serratia rubidaea]
MNQRIEERLGVSAIQAKTFHALALQIIQQGSRKVPVISKLETDSKARRDLLIANWQQQCAEKKAQAKGWRQWLTEELAWKCPKGTSGRIGGWRRAWRGAWSAGWA